jgi:hypothetical protein
MTHDPQEPGEYRLYLLAQIEKCLRLARITTDSKVAAALREMAEEYQAKLNQVDKASHD